MQKNLIVALAILSSILSQPAAANAYCTGTISTSWVSSNGNVYILGSWRGDHTMICSIKAEWNGITPDVCAAWMAEVDAAISLSRSVTLEYVGLVSCDALPAYEAAPAPNYVMLR